jgi:hypothetical protein
LSGQQQLASAKAAPIDPVARALFSSFGKPSSKPCPMKGMLALTAPF